LTQDGLGGGPNTLFSRKKEARWRPRRTDFLRTERLMRWALTGLTA